MLGRPVGSSYNNSLKYSIRKCSVITCNYTETFNGKKWGQWYKINGKFVCRSHYDKLIATPKITPEYNKRRNSRITPEYKKQHRGRTTYITFKNKRIYLNTKLRKGKCEWCSKKVGDEYINWKGEHKKIKLTNIHHIQYYIIFAWFDTVELCNSCHSKESARLKKIM